MSRRIQRCIKCEPEGPTKRHPFTIRRGWTRHDDRVCAACRHARPTERETAERLTAYRGRGA